jgi:hypothetical protein
MFQTNKGAQIALSRLSPAYLEAYSSLHEMLEHLLLIWTYSYEYRHIPTSPSTITTDHGYGYLSAPVYVAKYSKSSKGLSNHLTFTLVVLYDSTNLWGNSMVQHTSTPTKRASRFLRIRVMSAVKFSVWTDSSSVRTRSSTTELRPTPCSPRPGGRKASAASDLMSLVTYTCDCVVTCVLNDDRMTIG